MDIFHQKSKEESVEASQANHHKKEKETPEQQWEEKAAAEKVVEFEMMQEQVNNSGPTQQTNDPKKNANQVLKDLKLDGKLQNAKPEPEPLVETEEVPKKDLDWVDKVEDVIKKDKDKPYQEEEDAEALQQDYLKKSFKEDIRIDQ